MTIRRFGRYHSPDPRDRKFRQRATTVSGIKHWHEGGWCGNQGGTSACVGFAFTHWLVAYPIRQWLAPMGIYELAQHLDEWDGENYNGTSVRAGAKVLHRLKLISEYRWATTVDEMVSAILTTGPVVTGMNWYAGMGRPDDKGRITISGKLSGGHAMLASGVNTNTELFRFKNSWGTNWGKGGHCWIGFDDMAHLLQEDGEACLGIEREAKP